VRQPRWKVLSCAAGALALGALAQEPPADVEPIDIRLVEETGIALMGDDAAPNHVMLLDEVGAEANLSRTSIYPVLTGAAGPLGVNFGANLADFTGGDYNRALTALETLTDKAGRGCGCYYRIALEPPRESPRRVYRLTVSVRDRRLSRGYRVRYLREIDRWMRRARAVLEHPTRAVDVPLTARSCPWRATKEAGT
jgi:hypothetical protein